MYTGIYLTWTKLSKKKKDWTCLIACFCDGMLNDTYNFVSRLAAIDC